MIEEYIAGLKNEINKLKIENWNLKYANNEFTWIYCYNDKKVYLEDLVELYPEAWSDSLISAFEFWDKSCAYDVIVEATDDFEERLQMDYNVNVSFIEQSDTVCDYHILIGQFLGQSMMEMEKLVDKNNELQVKNHRLHAENSKLRKKIEKYINNE